MVGNKVTENDGQGRVIGRGAQEIQGKGLQQGEEDVRV